MTAVRELPSAVTAVLDMLGTKTSRPVRLWATREGGLWVRLYPPGDNEPRAPSEAGLQHPISNGRVDDLRLEIEDPAADAEELGVVAHAIERILAYEREAAGAAKELAERYEEINLLYSISETLGSVLSLQDASHRILAEVADLLVARRASLWVYSEAEHTLELVATVGDQGMARPIPVDDQDSITARVFRERQPINLEQGTDFPRASTPEPRPQEREAFLSVPIQFTPPEGAARTVGVITLVGRTTNVRFTAGDVRLLSAIASQIGAALETHRLMEENIRQERVVREMELAHDLQMKLLPDVDEFRGTAHVAARCVPADQVGGDFYHLFRLAGDRLGVMIGDVSSHGFSAALIMALTMSAVAIYAQEADPPAEVLRRVHQALVDELQTTEMYMTLFYGVLDPAERRLVFANAGHPHAFRLAGDGSTERLGATSAPLGIVPLADYMEEQVAWDPDTDVLCLFTDGLSDTFTSTGGLSGETALLELAVSLRDLEPTALLDRLFEAAAERATGGVPADDRTAVLVRA